MRKISLGDFTSLAKKYTKYRPGYSKNIVKILANIDREENHAGIRIADVGAGTGIFTRLIEEHFKKEDQIFAIEPNEAMREEGINFQGHMASRIVWKKGDAEETTLETNSIDLISMASAFHWPDTKKALSEFNRILRPGGVFAALWNPRITELSDVETMVNKLLIDDYKVTTRVSSGRSGLAENMTKVLQECDYFKNIVYCESLDKVVINPDQYIGAWESVNDIRSQLGEDNFIEFLQKIRNMLKNTSEVPVYYLTRCWIAYK